MLINIIISSYEQQVKDGRNYNIRREEKNNDQYNNKNIMNNVYL